MPSLSRTLFCTVPAALLVALLSGPITPVAAMASPLPMPLQADYASRMAPTVRATHLKLMKKAHNSVAKKNHTVHAYPVPHQNMSRHAYPPELRPHSKRDNSAEFDALLSQFSSGRDDAVSNSQDFRESFSI